MKKGMTLVELIVTIAIIAIIMVFVATSFSPIFVNYGVQKTMSQNKDMANTSMVIIKNAIRDAKGYVGPDDGNGCDAKIFVSQESKSLIFKNVEDGLPASYYSGVKEISLYFNNNVDNVQVTLNINGYSITSTIAPYKEDKIIGPGGTGSLCIRKEASPD